MDLLCLRDRESGGSSSSSRDTEVEMSFCLVLPCAVTGTDVAQRLGPADQAPRQFWSCSSVWESAAFTRQRSSVQSRSGSPWARSSFGRALGLHPGGSAFDPRRVHPASVAHLAERVLGKDEVPGSIPGRSFISIDLSVPSQSCA